MAFLLGFGLATLGFVLCITVGVLYLLIPRWRQLAPYALLVYPSAYFAGLFCFFFFGFLIDGIMERYSNSSFVGWIVDWIGVLLISGLVVVGALAGAISGLACANRLWWRFFAGPGQQVARPESPGWLELDLTPFIDKARAWFLYHWARSFGHQASHKRAAVTKSEVREKYQGAV